MSLIVENLSVGTGERLLVSDVSFTLKPGEMTAVLGSNGAGKSELVMGLAGMLMVRNGSIVVEGQELAGRDPATIRQSGVAAVPEGHRVLTKLNVDDNLRVAGLLQSAELEETLAEVYKFFPEMAERKGQIAETMSGGQQQMLALGQAMMAKPKFLLIDEMSLGLAPLIVKRLMGFVEGLKEQGTGILLIEQFADLALEVADHAIVMRSGKPRYHGPAAELKEDPDKLSAAYFGG
jgi:branched-chain amino acid transport system ATP-binding protein